MHCPLCSFPVESVLIQGVEVERCGRCEGTFFEPGEAPRIFGEGARFETWRELWLAQDAEPSLLRCPKDETRMLAHTVAMKDESVVLDVCPHCDSLWLDRDEGRQLHALVESARAAEQEALRGHGAAGYLFQLFTQLPIEVWNPLRRKRYLVHIVLAVLAVCFALQLLEKAPIRAHRGLWMMVPVQVLRGQHLWTLLTYGCFHSGWVHLLGNLYFLWIFGDNVEDRLGKRGFVIIYLAGLIVGGLAHLFTNLHSSSPLLGASGAIAALMGAYLVLFPQVRLWVMLLVVRVRLRATWYLGLWVALQIVMQLRGIRGTAWMTHVGGFAVGGLTALWLRRRPTVQWLRA